MKYSTFIDARGEFARQINFLSKAISDDETRYFMQFLHIEASEKKEGRFMGVTTDGRQLHKVDPLACPFDNLEAGDWRVIKSDLKKRMDSKTGGNRRRKTGAGISRMETCYSPGCAGLYGQFRGFHVFSRRKVAQSSC
jgi:hypothetical protein